MDVERRAETVAWLLAGDPAVRWQVQRDLLDDATAVVAAQRVRVATEGWGARLLAEQSPDGTWGGGVYNPKFTSTTYTLLLLCQLGLPADNPQAVRGCERLLEGACWYDGGLSFARTVREPETCITAIVIAIVATFAAIDDRISGALSWLLDQQLGDGGWNCDTVRRGSAHGSFNTTILALEALRAWSSTRGEDAVVTRAAERGREFFLDHRLYRSHRTGHVVSPSYTRMVFPPTWHHDLLRGLDYFQSVGALVDERLTDPVERLRSRQRTDGTWVSGARHPGRYWFDLEEPRAPNRMNTLRGLRVLRWWDSGATPVTSTTADHLRTGAVGASEM